MYRYRRIVALCAAVVLSLGCVTFFSFSASADDNASMGWYISLSAKSGNSWVGPFLVPCINGVPNIVTTGYTDRNTWRINGFSHRFTEDRLTRGTFYVGFHVIPMAYNISDGVALWNVNTANDVYGNNVRLRMWEDSEIPNDIDADPFHIAPKSRYMLLMFSLVPDALDPYWPNTGTFDFVEDVVVSCMNSSGQTVSSKLCFYDVDVVYYPNFYEMVSAGLDNSNIAQRLVYYVMQIAQRSYDAQLGEMATLIYQMEADTSAISSDVADIAELENEHNTFQHEIQDQMTGAWDSYSSGASSGSDALEDADPSALSDFNNDALQNAISGKDNWWAQSSYDDFHRVPTIKIPDDYIHFTDDWFSKFYNLLGGGE